MAQYGKQMMLWVNNIALLWAMFNNIYAKNGSEKLSQFYSELKYKLDATQKLEFDGELLLNLCKTITAWSLLKCSW